MKWFKHFSMAKFDVKIMRLIRAHSIEGYGIYWACLESIASNLEPSKPLPDMEENDKDIAELFGMDTDKVRDIIQFCIKEGLFQKDEKSGKLVCLKLLSHLDNTMSNVPQIRGILDNFRKLQGTSSELKQLEGTCSRLDKSRVDKIRVEKKSEPSVPFSLPHGNSFSLAWTEWLEYRKEKGKKVSPIAAKKQLNELSKVSEAEAVAAINKSIASDWQGIFTDKTKPQRPSLLPDPSKPRKFGANGNEV